MPAEVGPRAVAEPGSDAEYVRLAQEGDLDAFEVLYRRNVGRVYALCMRMVANAERAEELTQDAFVRAWSKLSSFRGDSAFSSWMHRLTVNLVLSAQRSRRRREARIVAVEDPASLERPAAAPEGAAPEVDLEKALATLPERARQIFVLYEVEGYRHDEIAGLTGLRPGTSKAHLHRARKLLRKALSK